MYLALTPIELVDLEGADKRYAEEQRQFNIKDIDPKYHKDLGLVIYEGQSYYASLYNPPAEDE